MIRKKIASRVVVCCLILALTVIGYRAGMIIWQSNEAFAYNGTDLVRLHVVANSNSPADQDLKLKVRDAILAATKELFTDVPDQSEAKRIIADNWHMVQDVALSEITRAGYDYQVLLELGSLIFLIGVW